jgi:hypothetical protein
VSGDASASGETPIAEAAVSVEVRLLEGAKTLQGIGSAHTAWIESHDVEASLERRVDELPEPTLDQTDA